MDSIKIILVTIATFLCISCTHKSKTELYLERGLDVLNNVKTVEFEFIEGYTVHRIGVIRDERSSEKTLVLDLGPDVELDHITKYSIGIRAEYKIEGQKIVEQWDFKPELTLINEYNYLITKIPYTSAHKIDKVKFYLYDRIKFDGEIGRKHELKNLYTNND